MNHRKERNILYLISARVLTATADPYIYENHKCQLTCNFHTFYFNARKTKQEGFQAIEKKLKQFLGVRESGQEAEFDLYLGRSIGPCSERLSRDDDLTGDSNSIINQKKMLEDYAKANGFTNCVHFTDDGWSGGSFDRPSWKRMIEGIEKGEIAASLPGYRKHSIPVEGTTKNSFKLLKINGLGLYYLEKQ